ncbi:uncharacterized protein BDZ99DRAFT_507552 [Mytilinidion resinicola]|uniref:DUF218 domain-containing protein n=1 Tax=Mytilinidion resinicola TaxID=574789 RepID=A0A6A6YW62_9PEZI|nr:uncharacterized protein BDZ99DRAFT_507552 [Mytilinidion resinicola]KAF2812137.1 hypothetical protein BDZ99DRAFT_507552 [Mytilinidion resinicola]
MAPATPSRMLPKSVHHRNNAATASATVALHPPDPHSDPYTEDDTTTGVHSFNHPPHPIPEPNYDNTTTLVIVCCHAIFTPDPSLPSFPLYSPYSESNWLLAPFQRSNPSSGKPSEHETFLAHLAAGLDALTTEAWTRQTLLVLSGGATKQDVTELSEARSYYHAALATSLAAGERGGGFPTRAFEEGRILLEEYATDSYQNLLFPILLFRRRTGRYPKQIRVVTHAFKARRFLELHARAIRWPKDRVRVQGIDPVMSAQELAETAEGEEKLGYGPWVDDSYGVGEVLAKKRKGRGWDEEVVKEIGEGLEESVKVLLGGKEPDDELPWEVLDAAQGD